MEKVQGRAIKIIQELKFKSYPERLIQALKLTLHLRQQEGDMTEVYKIVTVGKEGLFQNLTYLRTI